MVGVGAILPPIQGRMRVENLQAAHQQNRHAEQIGPMGQTGHARVPVNEQPAQALHWQPSFCLSYFTHDRSPVLFDHLASAGQLRRKARTGPAAACIYCFEPPI